VERKLQYEEQIKWERGIKGWREGKIKWKNKLRRMKFVTKGM
jgi:hypothetical protein